MRRKKMYKHTLKRAKSPKYIFYWEEYIYPIKTGKKTTMSIKLDSNIEVPLLYSDERSSQKADWARRIQEWGIITIGYYRARYT